MSAALKLPVYVPADGSHLSKINARHAGAVIDAIKQRDGVCSPEALVAEAADPASPIHALIYDKSQADAAASYYLDKARWLIRSVVVTFVTPKGETKTVRAYTNVSFVDPKQPNVTLRGYTDIATAMNDPQLQAQVIAQAQADLGAFRRRFDRYRDIPRIQGMLQAVEAALGK